MEIVSTWELVSSSGTFTVHRLRMPGGWLVRTIDTGTNSMSTDFISDPNWQWQIA